MFFFLAGINNEPRQAVELQKQYLEICRPMFFLPKNHLRCLSSRLASPQWERGGDAHGDVPPVSGCGVWSFFLQNRNGLELLLGFLLERWYDENNKKKSDDDFVKMKVNGELQR